MTRPSCDQCDNPSRISINGIETCEDHFDRTMDLIVDVMAIERGIPVEVARAALAKLFREAMK